MNHKILRLLLLNNRLEKVIELIFQVLQLRIQVLRIIKYKQLKAKFHKALVAELPKGKSKVTNQGLITKSNPQKQLKTKVLDGVSAQAKGLVYKRKRTSQDQETMNTPITTHPKRIQTGYLGLKIDLRKVQPKTHQGLVLRI